MDTTERLLGQAIGDIKSLETNLVNEITSSRVDIEMILKQIAVYLSMSTHSLSEVHDIVLRFNTTIIELRAEFSKINTIENEIIKLPTEFLKLKQAVEEKLSVRNTDIDRQLMAFTTYVKRILGGIHKQSERLEAIELLYKDFSQAFKAEIASSQKNLAGVINKLIESKEKVDEEATEVAKANIEQRTDKYKVQMNLIVKIAGILLGSGGVIFMIIDLAIKSASKGGP